MTWDAGGIDVNTFLFFYHTCFVIIYIFSFDFSFLFKEFNQFYQLILCLYFFNLSFISFYLLCSVNKRDATTVLKDFVSCFLWHYIVLFLLELIGHCVKLCIYYWSSLDRFKFHWSSLIDDKESFKLSNFAYSCFVCFSQVSEYQVNLFVTLIFLSIIGSWDFIYAEYVMAAGYHNRSIVWQVKLLLINDAHLLVVIIKDDLCHVS